MLGHARAVVRQTGRIRWAAGRAKRLTLLANALSAGRVVKSAAAKLPHWIGEFSPDKLKPEDVMLVMVLLGLLIPLGVGVLALMEFKAPPRTAVAIVQPLAETTVGISDSHDALAKTDRLEVTSAISELPVLMSSETPSFAGTETPAQVSSETPPQPAVADKHIPPSEGTTIGSSEAVGSSTPPRVIKRHRHDPKPRKVVTVALPKPKPRAADTRRTVISERPRSVSDTETCRLSAFGGLQKALNSADCEI